MIWLIINLDLINHINLHVICDFFFSCLVLCSASHSPKAPSHNELVQVFVILIPEFYSRVQFFPFAVTNEIIIYCWQWLPNWPCSSAPSSSDALPSKQYFQNLNLMFPTAKSLTRSPTWNPIFSILWYIHTFFFFFCLCMHFSLSFLLLAQKNFKHWSY